MEHLTKTTNRKFYNKWNYKITVYQPGAHVFRYSLDQARVICDSATPSEHPYKSNNRLNKIFVNKDDLFGMIDILEKIDSTKWFKRIEGEKLDIYTNDRDIYDDLSLKFKDKLTHRFQPGSDEDLLDDYVIVSKKYPHDIYQYRVYLLPHKLKNDKLAKEQYLKWVNSQAPKIRCTEAVNKWFMYTDWNWDRRYVLVDSEQTLLMLKLRNSEVVGRVYKYIISDK